MNKIIYILMTLFLLTAGYFVWQKISKPKPDLNSPSTYYKIFNDKEFLSGREETAKEVDDKLNARLKQYHKEFATIAGTKDEKKLKALFYMNFVQMYGYYFERDLPKKKDFKHLLWNTRANNCGSNTMILAMLLDRAGYEYRTIAINKMSHGYVEVKFDDGWQLLDPTTNLWINKSTENLTNGQKGDIKQFFLKADDPENKEAQKHLERGNDVTKLRDNMIKIGQGFDAVVDEYNYVNLSEYKY